MLNYWYPPPVSITPPSTLDGFGVVHDTTPFFWIIHSYNLLARILLREDRSGGRLAGIVIIYANPVWALVNFTDIANRGGKYDRLYGRSGQRNVPSAGLGG